MDVTSRLDAARHGLRLGASEVSRNAAVYQWAERSVSSQEYLVSVFEDTMRVAQHAHRETIQGHGVGAPHSQSNFLNSTYHQARIFYGSENTHSVVLPSNKSTRCCSHCSYDAVHLPPSDMFSVLPQVPVAEFEWLKSTSPTKRPKTEAAVLHTVDTNCLPVMNRDIQEPMMQSIYALRLPDLMITQYVPF
ncbi:hypothetical protein B0H14DRAFT_2609463 [Mycena olivaceomarginata]|nr:hypothetical protein B0H14DRAFT_2609463 [Mycena olivaceomarginata]